MELTGNIKSLDTDLLTGKAKILLEINEKNNAISIVQKLKDCKISIALKKFTKKRSLNANAYSWVLTDKLSDALIIRGVKLSKDEMHAEMIFRYGQRMLDENGQAVIYSTSQDVKMQEFYTYSQKIGESILNHKRFKHYSIFRGSHTYDTQEFSIFLNGIIEECKEQGIETETPEEIQRMLSTWEAYRAQHFTN